jgi:autotransporter-associated beta strand protein
VANADATINSQISGAVALTKSGGSILTLGGNNDFATALNISTGTVKLGGAGTAPNGPLVAVQK